ncbi:uncharacterized protein METZ01_LOCUS467401, partial [marine metagenome]
MQIRLFVYFLLILPVLTRAEMQYSHRGHVDFGTIHRLSDGSIIKIPYRMLTYEPVLSINDFNIVANTALEFRFKDID